MRKKLNLIVFKTLILIGLFLTGCNSSTSDDINDIENINDINDETMKNEVVENESNANDKEELNKSDTSNENKNKNKKKEDENDVNKKTKEEAIEENDESKKSNSKNIDKSLLGDFTPKELSLNIRKTPSLKGDIVGTANPGTKYKVTDIESDGERNWSKIENGWISTSYLIPYKDYKDTGNENSSNKDKTENKNKSNTKTKSNKKSKTESNKKAATENKSGNFIVNQDSNIRSFAGVDYDIIGGLSANTKVTASKQAKASNGVYWYYVTANNGTKGWINSSLLTNESSTNNKTKTNNNNKQNNPKNNNSKETNNNTAKAPESSPSEFERRVIELTNSERKKAGLSSLKTSNQLVASARSKSEDMAKNKYFAHKSPTYGSAGEQLLNLGVPYRGWGENIAKGFPTAEEVVEGWMGSPSHKENILHPKMTHIGVGYDPNGHHWTQHFSYQ